MRDVIKVQLALRRVADTLDRRYPLPYITGYADTINLLREVADELAKIEQEEQENELKSRSHR